MTVKERAKLKKFSYVLSEDRIKDMNFLCEIRDYVNGTDWDCHLALGLVERALNEVEEKLTEIIGKDLYYKRLDYENRKKVLKKMELAKKKKKDQK